MNRYCMMIAYWDLQEQVIYQRWRRWLIRKLSLRAGGFHLEDMKATWDFVLNAKLLHE